MTHFKSGGSSITDKPRSGRPSTAVTEENRVLVDELIRSDRRITVREIVEKIGTGHNAAQNIISELGYSQVSARWVLLHHDNARPHPAHATAAAIAAKGWTVLPHPAYSPDLAPSGFHICGPLKDCLRGQKFEDDEAAQTAAREWFRQCSPDFFSNGFVNWQTRWEKCVARNGDYIEK